MRRNLTKLKGNKLSDLIGKPWIKKNTGAYGTVVLPSETDCISLRGDTQITPEKSDEQSNAKSQGRDRYKSIRGRGQTKVAISADFDMSGDVTKESPSGILWELALGKKTQINSLQGASVSVTDPTASKAGIVVTSAGDLNGLAGNYASIELNYGGSTGSASLSSTNSPAFVLTYFGDSTVQDVVTALDGHADLACVADSAGDDTTDLFADTLANCGLADGDKLYLAGGSPAGWQYDNSEAPVNDATMVWNKEKAGYVLSGLFFDKWSVEVNDKAPSQKFEGMAKYSLLVGYTTVAQAVSNNTKVYVSDYKVFAEVDTDAPQYVDIVDNDGVTKKSSGRRIVSKDVDGGGTYVILDQPITCDENDYIAFFEPNSYKPVVAPQNGLGGQLKLDNEVYTDVRNIKWEGSNNLEVFDNFALQKTIAGYVASKYQEIKVSMTLLARSDKMGIIEKLTRGETVTIPVEMTLGTIAGKKVTLFARFVEFKAPDLTDKAEASVELNIEGKIVAEPSASNVPGFVIIFS